MNTENTEQLLTQEQAELITNCQRQDCGAPLDRGYSWHGKMVSDEWRVTLVQCFRCAEKERYTEYKQTKVITSRLLLDALYLKDENLSKSIEAVQAKVKEFEQVVWFGGMQSAVVASQRTGMSYEVTTTKTTFTVMTCCSAARCLITLQTKDGKHVTAITEEKGSAPRMGIQGILATEQEALDLIQAAITFHKIGYLPKDDEKVRIW